MTRYSTATELDGSGKVRKKLLEEMRLSSVWPILLFTPFVLAAASCAGLVWGWQNAPHRTNKLFAVGSATAAALCGCGSLVYREVAGPLPPFDYSVEGFGLLLSLSAVVVGLVALRSPQWFSALALVASGWLFVLFFMMASTY
jgi:hypothetical protein